MKTSLVHKIWKFNILIYSIILVLSGIAFVCFNFDTIYTLYILFSFLMLGLSIRHWGKTKTPFLDEPREKGVIA
jgi:hypothetical protein